MFCFMYNREYILDIANIKQNLTESLYTHVLVIYAVLMLLIIPRYNTYSVGFVAININWFVWMKTFHLFY